MPIYEYRCNDCEQVFEEWLRTFDETEHTCPVCGGHAERIMSNTTFVLKGGGWYVSEYGKQSASTAGASSDVVKPAASTTDAGTASASAGSGTASAGASS